MIKKNTILQIAFSILFTLLEVRLIAALYAGNSIKALIYAGLFILSILLDIFASRRLK